MLKREPLLPEARPEIVDTHDVSDLYFDCDESMQLSLPEPDELETDYETEPEEVAGGSPGKVIFHIESSESDYESDFIADSYRVYHVNLTRAKAVAIKCVIGDVRDKLTGLTRPFPIRVIIVDEDMRVDVDEYIEPGRKLEFLDTPRDFRIEGILFQPFCK
ncbi:unnamed protein product [Allacma fusca]|uniref:Uncharacterized protein n=1 Tax=Allacma fusca TaxID=39272 RepID=A0A8J2PIV3_9HEXA|nr:unnamed protein product [Allacma fusca]